MHWRGLRAAGSGNVAAAIVSTGVSPIHTVHARAEGRASVVRGTAAGGRSTVGDPAVARGAAGKAAARSA